MVIKRLDSLIFAGGRERGGVQLRHQLDMVVLKQSIGGTKVMSD